MKKILVANRGEIALNAIRCIREMGLIPVAVYSEADENALHIRYAEKVVRLPGERPTHNYASIERIVEAAEQVGADAIYPGYGFLSESPELALACRDRNLTYVGPTPEVLKLCRNKLALLEKAAALGLRVPKHSKPVKDEEDLVTAAQAMGYPVLIKPVLGSGARFIAKAYRKEDLVDYYRRLGREQEIQGPRAPFYLEEYIRKATHVEITVLADETGQVIQLGERECVIQRRFQKLISETPSAQVPPALVSELAEAALDLVRTIEFTGCCSVEFLVDSRHRWYFMEINPRIQVEYALTELRYGVEVIKEQFRIAAGEKLRLEAMGAHPRLHAIECRINAEDPMNDFRPSAGVISEYYLPGGFGYSVLSSVQKGHRVDIYYDPMILKLNCFAGTRDEALAKLRFALDAIRLKGIHTNIPFLRRVVASTDFEEGKLKIDFKAKDYLPGNDRNRKHLEVAAIVAAMDQEIIGHQRTPSYKRRQREFNVWNMSGRLDLINRRSL